MRVVLLAVRPRGEGFDNDQRLDVESINLQKYIHPAYRDRLPSCSWTLQRRYACIACGWMVSDRLQERRAKVFSVGQDR